ncbi:MAG: winged helix-turn-helix transcriptional regulator [Bacteroidales bacterium]|nr:winged helix-turn-helix transcriptional regulator [Bacteroidales bacterium]
MICNDATLDDIDRSAVNYFVKKAINARRINDSIADDSTESVLQNLKLINSKGEIKNAGILLFGKQPSEFFHSVQFKIGRFKTDETDLIVQDVIDGNIIQMADKVVDVLKSKYLHSPIHYEGLQRIEPLEIPETSLREAIFNAIIHKDYGFSSTSIQMKVYDDRIWLWNNGNLPDGYTIETLLTEHSSQPRNPLIAEVFYRAGFIEAWGRGIKKIFDGVKNYKQKQPLLQSTMGGMLIEFFRNDNDTEIDTVNKIDNEAVNNVNSSKNDTKIDTDNKTDNDVDNTKNNTGNNNKIDTEKLNSMELQILGTITLNNKVSYTELMNIFKVSRSTVARALKHLQERNIIARQGSDRKGYWQIKVKKNFLL